MRMGVWADDSASGKCRTKGHRSRFHGRRVPSNFECDDDDDLATKDDEGLAQAKRHLAAMARIRARMAAQRAEAERCLLKLRERYTIDDEPGVLRAVASRPQ